jgi:hypothetical protein
MNARVAVTELQEKLAEFRAAADQNANCALAVERYYEIRSQAPAMTTPTDRLSAARCLSRQGRFDDASAELYALRDDAPELKSAVTQELQRNAARKQQLAQRQQQQRGAPAQTPAVHAAPKAKKATDTKSGL